MNLDSPQIVAIAVAVVVVLAIAAVVVTMLRKRKQRREQLKRRYGAEYARTVDEAGSERKAEEQLHEREARRERLDIRPLTSGDRSAFRGRFEAIEASFVDGPDAAVRSADALLDEVAERRGYPEAAAEQRLEDLAVDHPAAVDRYRSSRPKPGQGGTVTTEQHRQAMIGSRALFESLLGRDERTATDAPPSFRDIIGEDEGSSSPRNGDRATSQSRR